MKGIELARAYWETYGIPMIREQFPEYGEIIAAALTGSGSECYGFDDEVSLDHDFEPGFCLFIPGEEIVDRRTAFQLERAYAKLPAEFEGFRRQKMNPVGGQRHGVFRIDEYFTEKIGCPAEELTAELLRELMLKAGVHEYAPGCAQWASKEFLLLNRAPDAEPGELEVTLRRDAERVTDLYSGKVIPVVDRKFKDMFAAPETKLYLIFSEKSS